MVTVDNVGETVDEVAEIPVDAALAGEMEEEIALVACWVLGMIHHRIC